MYQQVIKKAGHHVYADQPALFNDIVNRTCDQCDRPITSSDWYVPTAEEEFRGKTAQQQKQQHQERTLDSHSQSEEGVHRAPTDCNANPVLDDSCSN